LARLAAIPGISAVEIDANGRFRIEFHAEQEGKVFIAPPAPMSTPSAPIGPSVKLVPGTPFPDDGSPIDLADLTLTPPDLDDREQN
jgi:hypothetical protein